MPVSTIDNSALSAINGQVPAGIGGGDELRDSFMTLLVTQLKNQDPLNPMQNAEMTSQLAQINTVSGIGELNDTLAGIDSQIDAGQTLQAASLIGKGVMVPGDRVLVGEGGSTTPIGIELEQSAEVSVAIIGSGGEVLRRFEPFSVSAGTETLQWDGRLEDGSIAPEGAYRVSVSATNGDSNISTTTLNYALVSGVSPGDNGPLLDVGGVAGQVALDEVRSIL